MHWSVCPCASKILIVIKYQGVSQSCFSMFWKITSKLCLGNWDENFSRKPIIVSGFIRGKLDEPLYCCSLNFFIDSTLLLYQFVVLIIALLVETFAAELALIGLISGVYSDVCIQCRTFIERLTTELAFMGFLLSVNYLVHSVHRCWPRVPAWRKPLPHTLQMKGRAPVCTGMCLVRL